MATAGYVVRAQQCQDTGTWAERSGGGPGWCPPVLVVDDKQFKRGGVRVHGGDDEEGYSWQDSWRG